MPVPAALLAAAAGGLGLDGAFPALGWWPLAFVSVLLALLSLQGRTIPESVLVGAAFGAAFYFPHVTWAASFLGDHPLAWVPWIALAAAETLLLAALSPLITLAYRWFPPAGSALSGSSLALSALVAGAWMTRELVLSSWPYGGFPWGRLAMTQSESPFAEAASWVGVAGLGFLMVLLCALALQVGRVLWQGRRGRTGAEQRRRWPARLPWSVIAPATLVILLALIPQYPTQPAGSLRIGAVQGNGPAAYADARNPGDVFNAQLSASRPLADEDVDLVLWPEGGVDCDPLADPGAALRLNAAARAYGAPILVNSAVETSDGIVNQSLLWTAEGPTASHGKRHPVPFGEYVPDRWLYEKLAPRGGGNAPAGVCARRRRPPH